MVCYINIETTPPFGTMPSKALVKVPRTHTKPSSIEKFQEDNAVKAWKDLALHRWTAQVASIAFILDEAPDAELIVNLWTIEREIFAWLDAQIKEMRRIATERREPLIFCAFNGCGFDFPILQMRGLKYGFHAVAGAFSMSSKWGDRNHIDPFITLGGMHLTHHEVALVEKKHGSLDDWLEFFEIKLDNPIRGSDVSEALLRADNDLVIRHTISRVLGLREIARRLHLAGAVDLGPYPPLEGR
jgi:hypothetical protein